MSSASDLFSDIDEAALLKNPPKDKIFTVSNGAVIHTEPIKNNKVETFVQIVNEPADGRSIVLDLSADINDSKIDQPLFVDGVFKGIITSVDTSGGNITVGLKDAEKLSDVYDSFDVMFHNDAIKTAVQRSISAHKISGRYDHLNAEPLKISVTERAVSNVRSMTNNEVVLRIDIPEGYYVPIRPHLRSCDFLNMECTVTAAGDISKNIDLGNEYTASGITFSTKGSYIEIGIGAYLRAHYDHNYITADVFDFDFAQSAYFKSNMTVSVSGELGRSWSTTLKLIGDIDVEIIHPYSLAAKTSVVVSPNIVFGVDGKMTGKITASSYVERSGEIRFRFDSTDMSHAVDNSIAYTPKDVSKDGVSIDIQADANAYIFPAVTMLPSLRFARITPPITLAFIRSGIKLNNNINGKIETGFVVENDSEIVQSSAVEATLTTSLEGLVQGMWYVRIAPVDIYSTGTYSDIFSTGKLNILEWKAVLLNAPSIDVKEHPGDYSKRDVSFDIDIDEKIKPKIYYYYTLDKKDIPIEDIASHKQVWKLGDAPIEIEKNTKIKVRAVLYNKDISNSIWAWGTSVSHQADELVALIDKPDVTPGSRSFKDSLWISMSQDQGYDIMYQLNGAAAVKYSVPLKLEKDSRVVVYARDEIDGEKIYSEKIIYNYDRCEDNEKHEGGICVASSSSSSSSSLSETSDSSSSSQSSVTSCPMVYDPTLDNDTSVNSIRLNYKDFNNRIECYYYESGQLKDELPYADGKPNGIQKYYYESGQIHYETPYTDGIKNWSGIYKVYYENGQLKEETAYSEGMKNGIKKVYYETGQLHEIIDSFVNDKLIGTHKYYKEDGEMYMCLAFTEGSTKVENCMH
jgi:antitoxin component YwqK of YwqJK toxin-antitoxin module